MMRRIHALAWAPLLAQSLWGAAYYVDAVAGSDANSGASKASAWRSLEAIKSRRFQPGDVVTLAAGTYEGGIDLDDSGLPGAPVTFRGEPGAEAPVLAGAPLTLSADNTIVENMKITGVRGEGIRINAGATGNIVRNCEIWACGAGLWVSGTDNLITKNYIHDLNIVVNTPGGDDDNGAVGIWMAASRVEISYNRFVNCKAPSYDYKYDGGAVEWWAESNLDGCYVHHNYATGGEGFMESGGRGATISNARVAYNVSVNNGWFALLNTTGQYAVKLENFVMEHNTVVQAGPHIGWGATSAIHFFDSAPKSVTLRNNIFHLDGWRVCDNPTITHSHNLFWFTKNGTPGFALDPTDKRADPLFVDPAGGNFQLLPGSPAIDMGVKTPLSGKDHLDRPLAGTAPDAGALEFQGGVSGARPSVRMGRTSVPLHRGGPRALLLYGEGGHVDVSGRARAPSTKAR